MTMLPNFDEKVLFGLSCVGLVTLLWTSINALRLLWRISRPSTNMSKYGAKSGAWVLVTGASDGIGKGFAQECAAQGFNVALMSRSKAKLDVIAQEIEQEFKVSTKVIVVNAGDSDAAEKVAQAVQGLCLRVLVNNVGIQTTEAPAELEGTSTENIHRALMVNIEFSTVLTAKLISQLRENGKSDKRSKRSAIINLSSISAKVPSPYLAVYAGCKAYNDAMSKAIAFEVEDDIDVLSITPAYVASNMTHMKRTSTTVISPRHLARNTLGYLGYAYSMSPYWAHALMQGVFCALPESQMGRMWKNALQTAAEKIKRRILKNSKKQ